LERRRPKTRPVLSRLRPTVDTALISLLVLLLRAHGSFVSQFAAGEADDLEGMEDKAPV